MIFNSLLNAMFLTSFPGRQHELECGEWSQRMGAIIFQSLVFLRKAQTESPSFSLFQNNATILPDLSDLPVSNKRDE